MNPRSLQAYDPAASIGLQLVSSFSSKAQTVFQLITVRLFFVFAVMLGPCALLSNTSSSTLAQQTSLRQVAFPLTIQWNKLRGVTTYRLQIASDETFRNVYYDGRVTGERYKLRGIPPGYYYWRIAPAESRASEFSRPVRFFVSGGFVFSTKPTGPAAMRPR
jgi:hypothetical protein